MNENICIGLFGTCGGSQWREPFKEKYLEIGLLPDVHFFDPQKSDWKPEDAKVEAAHLANDRIIVFPITNETYAEGSLAEVGFSILNAIRLDDRRHFIVYIDPDVCDRIKYHPKWSVNDPNKTMEPAAKSSIRSRALVIQHLAKLRLDGVYLVEKLEDALPLSLACLAAEQAVEPWKKFNPHRKIK